MTNARKTLLLFGILVLIGVAFEFVGLGWSYPFTYLAQDASRSGVAAFCLTTGYVLGHLFWGRSREDRITQHIVEEFGDPANHSDHVVRTHANKLFRIRVKYD